MIRDESLFKGEITGRITAKMRLGNGDGNGAGVKKG